MHGPRPGTGAQTTASTATIARRSTRGAVWLTVATGVQGFSGLAASIVLARLLGPSPYGIYTLAVAIIDVAGLVRAWGFNVVLIQADDDDAQLLGTAITLALFAGGLFLVLVTIGAWLVAPSLDRTVASLLPWLAVKMALLMVASCLAATLQRQLRFGVLASSAAASTVVCEILGISVAIAGGGPWALLTRDLAASALYLLFIAILMRRVPRCAWHPASARRLLRTGGGVLLQKAAETLQARLDRLSVGNLAGPRVLGLYAEAATLGGDSERAFAPILSQVGLGAYARLRHDHVRRGDAFALVQRMILRGALLVVTVLFVAPAPFLELLYGERWVDAAPFLRIFSLIAVGLPVYEHAVSLLYASGDVASVVKVRYLQVAAFVPLLGLGLVLAGPRGAAVAVDLALAFGLIGLGIAVCRHLGRPDTTTVRSILPPLIALAAGIISERFVPGGGNGRAALILHLAVPGIVYVSVLNGIERRHLWTDVGRVLRALVTRANP